MIDSIAEYFSLRWEFVMEHPDLIVVTLMLGFGLGYLFFRGQIAHHRVVIDDQRQKISDLSAGYAEAKTLSESQRSKLDHRPGQSAAASGWRQRARFSTREAGYLFRDLEPDNALGEKDRRPYDVNRIIVLLEEARTAGKLECFPVREKGKVVGYEISRKSLIEFARSRGDPLPEFLKD